MLDFDHACGRSRPSVAAIIYPFDCAHAPIMTSLCALVVLITTSLSYGEVLLGHKRSARACLRLLRSGHEVGQERRRFRCC